MKWIDLPPVWLFCFLGIAYVQSRYASAGLTFPGGLPDFLAGVLIGAGGILVGLAVLEFRRARTTIIPHNMPSHLITSGVFSRTRNPIYLADMLFLVGFILYWDAVLSLPLVPVLFWILERRFIFPEEIRMRMGFQETYPAYEARVRRWI
ncbi:methyltransferase family protein [Roseobacteraceae bacterium S113]